MNLTGPFGAFVAFFATKLLGSLLDNGIVTIDIQIDKLKLALQDKQWKQAAALAYQKASSRVYSEKEKIEIRKQYLDALNKYVTYGNGMSDSQNTKR